MNISIQTDAAVSDITINITCKSITPEIEKLISMLRIMDMKLTGIAENETYILDAAEVLYIDTANKKTFLYTKDKVYETNLNLYRLEEQLENAEFFRAGKSSIINFRHIRSLRAEIDGRILVTLSNGEKLYVSRQYAGVVKKKLERQKK